MGRPKSEIDMDAVLDLIEKGEKIPAISTELGISAPTLRSRVADLSKKQGLLLKYREVQALHLTELQARVLEAITPEKIEEANLRDLVMSYKILKEKEQVLDGKPTEIKGLVQHLIHLEKQENLADEKNIDLVEVIDGEVVEEEQAKTLLEELEELDESAF